MQPCPYLHASNHILQKSEIRASYKYAVHFWTKQRTDAQPLTGMMTAPSLLCLLLATAQLCHGAAVRDEGPPPPHPEEAR